MVGLPGTRVVPKGWEAHHRPVAESTMTGRADLFDAGAPAEYGQWDTSSSDALATDIPVRVQRLYLSLIHISEPTRRHHVSRMPSSA